MNEGIGAKGGKKDRKLSFLNRRKMKLLKQQELDDIKEKHDKYKYKKNNDSIISSVQNHKDSEPSATDFKILEKNDDTILQSSANDKPLPQEDEIISKNIIDISNHNKYNVTLLEKEPKKEKVLIASPEKKIKRKEKNKEKKKEKKTNINNAPTHDKPYQERKIDNIEEFLEKQIIKVLEQDIDEKKYQLKKMDSEIHTIQKLIDCTTDEEELIEIEKEIERLLDMLNQKKRQILALEKTFDLKFPVEEPDNYLIHLIEEYKSHKKEEKEFYKKLQDNQKFKSLINTVIEIEEKQEIIQQRLQDKKEQHGLAEEQVEKLNNDVINMEEMNQNIKKMIDSHNNLLEEIRQKVNETVHITERIDYITKNVDHTMLELFLLMAVLKHNLSIKNNAIAATTAAMALDMIIKMTTPIQEKVIIKNSDVKDYETMIRNCMDNTGFIDQTIQNNLNKISSIRYTFEKEYQSCSYLPSYQEALKKLTSLEEEMKERKNDVTRIKKDMELQLEKNNAKVKKYSYLQSS